MESLITQLIQEQKRSGISLSSKKSKIWFRDKVKELRITPKEIVKETDRYSSRAMIGKMYFYFYDPKTKDVLPYYDKFPLVIPLERYSDGFLGLNLHYVPPRMRLAILGNLWKRLNNQRMDETTRLRISYDYISQLRSFPLMRPCIKRYLNQYVRSRIVEIYPNEWNSCVMLPFERFAKATKKTVYGDPTGVY
jgi:hypothetical protein